MIPYLDEGVARIQLRNQRIDLIRITPKPNLITNLSYQTQLWAYKQNKNTTLIILFKTTITQCVTSMHCACQSLRIEAKTSVIIAVQYVLRYIMHVHAGLGRVNWNECASCLLTWYRGLGVGIRDLPGSVDGSSWPIGMRETTWGYDKSRTLDLYI